MMERSADAWEHNQFKEVVVKVANIEIYYKALTHYLTEQPMLLNDLLVVLAPRIDHTRVVKMFQKADELPSMSRFRPGSLALLELTTCSSCSDQIVPHRCSAREARRDGRRSAGLTLPLVDAEQHPRG